MIPECHIDNFMNADQRMANINWTLETHSRWLFCYIDNLTAFVVDQWHSDQRVS